MIEQNKWVVVTDRAREQLTEFMAREENQGKVVRIFSAGHG